jgi:hypothetical protein
MPGSTLAALSIGERSHDDCTRTHGGALVPCLAHCSLESGGSSFGGDPLGRFDQNGRRSGVERSGRLVDVPPDPSCRVAELRTATEQNIGPRDSSCDHDQRGPSGVGATAERSGPRYGMDTFAV